MARVTVGLYTDANTLPQAIHALEELQRHKESLILPAVDRQTEILAVAIDSAIEFIAAVIAERS